MLISVFLWGKTISWKLVPTERMCMCVLKKSCYIVIIFQLHNWKCIDILPSTGLGSIIGHTMEIENNVSGTIASYPSWSIHPQVHFTHTYQTILPSTHAVAYQLLVDIDIIKHLHRNTMSRTIHPFKITSPL